MHKKLILTLGCLMLAGLGCGSSRLVQTEDTQDQLRVIVQLETRSEITTVMSGPGGRAYTVSAKDGTVLEREISELELWTKFPAIYHLVTTSYAQDGKDSAIWAGGNL
ncbi:MAG: hypothetical protein AMJ65_11020 [Phycisphaerae bacterium SG8_4]|nr:MAG: hypothetical protein AMJ65_11020 [Phycisphaerae bacterium SG8_4]